jgi:hypothetical protein
LCQQSIRHVSSRQWHRYAQIVERYDRYFRFPFQVDIRAAIAVRIAVVRDIALIEAGAVGRRGDPAKALKSARIRKKDRRAIVPSASRTPRR